MIQTNSSLADDTFNLPPSLCLEWNALQMNAKEQQFAEVILRAWIGHTWHAFAWNLCGNRGAWTMKGVCVQSCSTVNGQFINPKFY